MRDALSQMEHRANTSRGRSIFENANLTQQERQRNFARALGVEGNDQGVEVKDENEEQEVEETEEEEQEGQEADQEENPTESEETSNASGAEGMAFPSVDPENVERQLAGTIGKKAAKDITDTIVRPLAQQADRVAQQTAQVRIERVKEKFVKMYPELKRKEALNAVVQSAIRTAKPGESDEAAFRRGLINVYGDRRAEMRSQVANQMSSPSGRSQDRSQKYTREEADLAALTHYQKTGDLAGARALKDRLLRS